MLHTTSQTQSRLQSTLKYTAHTRRNVLFTACSSVTQARTFAANNNKKNWQLAQLVRSFGLLFVCRSRLDCPENRTRKTAEKSTAEERNETKMCAYVSNWNCAGFVLEEHVRKSNEKHFSCKLSCRLQQYVRVTQRVSFVIQLKAKKAVPTPPLLDHLEIKANYKSPRGISAVDIIHFQLFWQLQLLNH